MAFHHHFEREGFRQAMQTSPPPQPACSRCGTCCRKGGPALHGEDRHLVEQGLIHTRHLYTIRRGEWVHDPITGALAQAAGEIIKIKGGSGTWACRFFDDGAHACRIYADRPLECRTLTCGDTAAIERIYAADRLTREDLISGIAGLWELVAEHQKRCDVERLRRLRVPADGSEANLRARELAQMIRYDAALRSLVVSQAGLEAGMTDFLFGRPLPQVLNAMERAVPGPLAAPPAEGRRPPG
jgi:Fe-S-cluster containining protein